MGLFPDPMKDSGAYRFLLAQLTWAVSDLKNIQVTRLGRINSEARSAWAWISAGAEESCYFFSFCNVCRFLGFNADATRAALQPYWDGACQDAERSNAARQDIWKRKILFALATEGPCASDVLRRRAQVGTKTIGPVLDLLKESGQVEAHITVSTQWGEVEIYRIAEAR